MTMSGIRSCSRTRARRRTLDCRNNDDRNCRSKELQASERGTLPQTEAELLDNPVAGRPTLILRSPDFHSITEVVAEPIERRTPIGWWLFFIPSLALLSLLGVAVSWLFLGGVRLCGLNGPPRLAVGITDF